MMQVHPGIESDVPSVEKPNYDALDSALFCPQCGYDLRAMSSDRCPECGLSVDRATLAQSLIPWVHRKRIGNVRALWRTVWLATARSRQLPDELSRPIDYREAQIFRLITVLIGSIPVALVPSLLMLRYGPVPLTDLFPDPTMVMWTGRGAGGMRLMFDLLLPWAAGMILPPVLPIALVLFVICVSGVHSYHFHPRSIPVLRQNRAIALSYYAIAPMAWLVVPTVLLGWAIWLQVTVAIGGGDLNRSEFRLFALLITIAATGFLIMPLAVWWNLIRILWRATNNDVARTTIAAVIIPIEWFMCGVLTLVALPWVVGFVCLVLDSLR